jgi:hypothetical protein
MDSTRSTLLTVVLVLLTIGLSLADSMEELPGWRDFVFAFIREAYAWIMICTLCGLARRYIRSGSRLLSILSCFPCSSRRQSS